MSIVVPAYNAGSTIEPLLDSLEALDPPPGGCEIILVDNGRNGVLPPRPRVHYLQEPRRGSYAARNTGIQASQGRIVAFTDADCVVDRGWLRELLAAFEDAEIGAVAGVIRSTPSGSPLQALSEEQGVLDQETFFQVHRLPAAATANLAVRREVLDALGGFNASRDTSADFELCFRMQLELSRRLVLAPGSIVYHHHRATWAGVFEQAVRNGRASALLRRRFPSVSRPQPPSRRLAVLAQSLLGALRYPWTRKPEDLLRPVFLMVRYIGLVIGFCGAPKN